MDQYTFTLTTRRKYRNKQEWRPINVASWHDLHVEGDGFIVAQLARAVRQQYPDLPDADVVVKRGDTVCFTPAPLSVWAAGKFGKGEQPEQFRAGGE